MVASDAPRVPKYRLHKARGCAVVTLNGADIYLGRYGSPESRAKYNRLVGAYLRGEDAGASAGDAYPIARLCDEFLRWAKSEYRAADGSESASVDNVRLALRSLFELFADIDANAFGPRSLVAYRDELVRRGLARSTVNDRVKLVRRAFKWATEQERIAPSVLHGLQAVSGLRRGRGGARETEPVRPVSEADVTATLPFLPDPVRAAVELQLLTGARPGEVLAMRTADIDATGAIWTYRPESHKSSWRGHERSIFLGPRAQDVVAAFLLPDSPTAFLFSPTVAELRRRDRLRAARRVPLFPSHVRALERKRKPNPKRRPRDRYDVQSYRQAITRGCKRAGVAPWRPNQLRHTAATRLRSELGLDVAKAVLGHRKVETTQIYAEADRARAMQAMERMG